MEMRYTSQTCSERSSLASSIPPSAASSNRTDPWATPGFPDDGVGRSQDTSHDSPHEMEVHDTQMKIEPAEPATVRSDRLTPPQEASTTPGPFKRPRGRPRKHPLPDPDAPKTGKCRSKTGCITCRRRKKKCDETKPSCKNCDKNAFVCEGYASRTIWKGGKQAVGAASLTSTNFSHIRLGPIIHGVETEEDKLFFAHYSKLSCVCTTNSSMNNAFTSLLLPLAVSNIGLMHSILSLASKHLHHDDALAMAKDARKPVSLKTIAGRSQYHSDEAMTWLRISMDEKCTSESDISARFGQMLCLLFETMMDSQPNGQHRLHIQAYHTLVKQCPPPPSPLQDFIHESFEYHHALDDLILASEVTVALSASLLPPPTITTDQITEFKPYIDDSLTGSSSSSPSYLIGVHDGLFDYMSQVTQLRNTIRHKMALEIDPVIDYQCLFRAAVIDAGIRSWEPLESTADDIADDYHHLTGLIYRQMVWVYLWRTLYPPHATTWLPDSRIVQAVNDGLEMLRSVPADSPAQTLMLAPAFVLGCAAFEVRHREGVRRALGAVYKYRRFCNARVVGGILEEVWQRMDAKDETSWDWQAVAKGMGLDLLVA